MNMWTLRKLESRAQTSSNSIELKASKCRNCVLVPNILLNVYICKYTLPKQILLKYPNEDVYRTMEPNTRVYLNPLLSMVFKVF